MEKRNPSEIKNLFQIKNHLEKSLVRVMPLSAKVSLKHQEVLLRKKRLKKDYLEKLLIKNLALVDQIVTKNLLGIENLLIEKRVIVSPLLKVNLLQKLLLKSQQRLEHLDLPIQNQNHQNVKHAFRKIY